MEKRDFKVLIAGGSIAGLVLANMLEQLGIDFLVLEGYPEIAPQVGASIGFFPNGCRILDQIGCYDGVRGKLDEELMELFYNSAEGIPLSLIKFAGQHFVERHGYGIIFIDRQMAIEVFYENLKEKSKVLVNKRVATVTPVANGVQVTTEDGSTYSGDILVGADGVHSTIRKEMWRLGDELSPGRFPQSDRTDVTCDYFCMFGISQNVIGINNASTQTVLGKNNSYLVCDGPGNRIYWFLFVKNERTLRGMDNEIPRTFTEEDKKALAQKHWNDPITPIVKFGDLYEKHTSAVLTAIPEFVATEWHFGRTIITGDAVHKFNPISGQGGNNAIETAAALSTEILNMLNALPDNQSPSDADVTAAFQRTQKSRRSMASTAVDISHLQQTIFARETPVLAFLARVIPFLGAEGTFEKFSDAALPARRLPMLPMPKRPRFEPYHDELPSKPLGGGPFSLLLALGIFGSLFYVAVKGEQKPFFASGLNLQSLFIFPILFIWTLEGYRNANPYTFVCLPVVFGIAYQLVGIGSVAPLYFLLSVITTSRVIYTRAVGRPVPVAVSHAILPAVILGYVVPAALLPADAIAATPYLRAASPVLVAVLTYAGKRLLELPNPADPFDLYKNKDVGPVRRGLAVSFLVSTIAYVTSDAFFKGDFSTLPERLSNLIPTSMDDVQLLKNDDFALFGLVTALWSLYSVYELRRNGWATTKQVVVAALAVVVGQVLVGPVAVYSGLWFWREGVLSQKADTQGRKD